MRTVLFALALAGLAALAACGKKGPLYMPDTATPPAQSSAPTQ